MGAGEELHGRLDFDPGGGATEGEPQRAEGDLGGTPMARSVAFGVCSPAWQAEPVVNTTSEGAAPTRAARVARASSTAWRTRRLSAWSLEGLPSSARR